MDRRLARTLQLRGATRDEVARAEQEGWLALLALDKLLVPGRQRYDLREVTRRAGVDLETGTRLWRALGFPDLDPSVPVFTDGALRVLRMLEGRLHTTVFTVADDPLGQLVEQARMVSAALARVAEVVTDVLISSVRAARDSGLSDEQVALTLIDELDWPTLARLDDFTLRLLTRAALWRKLAAEDPAAPGALLLAVGFVDLVGYTTLSQELDADELTGLVQRFEQLAFDTVVRHGGRVVKMIGDEVMFVADDVAPAARIARRLAERSSGDELLPDARAGLAYGSVVAREGDYYGPVVNLASRLVELAHPGTVLVSDDVHRALEEDAGFTWRRLRGRRLRDIGRVEVWALDGVAGEPAPAG